VCAGGVLLPSGVASSIPSCWLDDEEFERDIQAFTEIEVEEVGLKRRQIGLGGLLRKKTETCSGW